MTRCTLALISVCLIAMFAVSGSALAAPTRATTASSPVANGFYRGQHIKYLDFGAVHLTRGNKVAPIWSVTNPVRGQHNIIDVVPGKPGYTPLWRVVMVRFKRGADRTLIRSAAQVTRLRRAGKVALTKTKVVVNCPVLGFGQPHVAGYYKGGNVQYLDLGPIKLASGNKRAPLWTVTNGTRDQHNIIDVVPGDRGYTPLWDINKVTWRDGVTPRTLKSRSDVEAAKAAGDVTVAAAGMVVNCPVV